MRDTDRIHVSAREGKDRESIPFAFAVDLVFWEHYVLVVNRYADADGHLAQILVGCPLKARKEMSVYTPPKKNNSHAPIANPQCTECHNHLRSFIPGLTHYLTA